MANWKKLLGRMLTDTSPTSYTYAEAASILAAIGFTLAPKHGGSHRKWRHRKADGTVVVVGLVDKGSGTLKAYLIRDIIKQLKEHDLVPPSLLDQ